MSLSMTFGTWSEALAYAKLHGKHLEVIAFYYEDTLGNMLRRYRVAVPH